MSNERQEETVEEQETVADVLRKMRSNEFDDPRFGRDGLQHTWPHLTVVLEPTESDASTTGKHISAMSFHGPMAKTARRQNGEESLPS